ncbi:MAG: adenylosuccinate synthase [Anaerolineae bacterium]|nr:adenylosuccinate synthase [Anaerolineae bacterium]
MPLDIIVGAQWGDEGKGRMVDLLAAEADFVARYGGGDNAGHTVTVGESVFKLHLIPSGCIHPHTVGVLGNGMLVNPATLLYEMTQLKQAGIEINPRRLRISHAAHLITPAHRAMDKAQEAARGKDQIGTTQRGIGPAYVDKIARRGLRAELMLAAEDCADAVQAHVTAVNERLTKLYGAEPLDAKAVAAKFAGYARQLQAYIGDISTLLTDALDKDKTVLAEGAQGTLLDLDHGTYPFVTSSSPTAAGALVGMGIGMRPARRVMGVTKVFQTRVGAGPFPSEVEGETAERLRGTGTNPWDEFGTTTGRPRRVGWLDLVLLRYARRINGLTELALTKLDILSGVHPLRLCVGYQDGGKNISELPMGPSNLEQFDPVYEEMPGWGEDVGGARQWADLPAAAQAYIERIEALSGVPVKWVSVGPEREQLVKIP